MLKALINNLLNSFDFSTNITVNNKSLKNDEVERNLVLRFQKTYLNLNNAYKKVNNEKSKP